MNDSELDAVIDTARQSGSCMIAVWHVEGDRLRLFRQTKNFPRADFDNAMHLLHDNLQHLPEDQPAP